jgi:hypothetical protein
MIAAIAGDISLTFLTDDVSFLMLQNYLNIFLVVTRECHMCMITSKKNSTRRDAGPCTHVGNAYSLSTRPPINRVGPVIGNSGVVQFC